MGLLNFFKNWITLQQKDFPQVEKTKKESSRKLQGKFHKKLRKSTQKKIKKKVQGKPCKKTQRKLAVKPKKKIRKKIHKKLTPKRLKKRTEPHKKLPVLTKEKEVGIITHYFGKISVGIIKLKAPLAVGEQIHIKGVHDDFTQSVSSMQYNHKDISYAGKGLEIGIKVKQPVHENDKVYIAN
jgi:putative protease